MYAQNRYLIFLVEMSDEGSSSWINVHRQKLKICVKSSTWELVFINFIGLQPAKRFFDEGSSEEQVFDDEYENFKVNTYFMILDQIKSDLKKRKIAYDNLISNYIFFYHLSEPKLAEVKKILSHCKNDTLYCIPATNCSAEQSFSTLKRVKSHLRSRMKKERLNALAVPNIESELTRALDYNDIIEDFANKQSRKKL
ncbi:hypothetical protein QTP88_013500 [Uroleucon formosanum]